jgi:hypothetical protein
LDFCLREKAIDGKGSKQEDARNQNPDNTVDGGSIVKRGEDARLRWPGISGAVLSGGGVVVAS